MRRRRGGRDRDAPVDGPGEGLGEGLGDGPVPAAAADDRPRPAPLGGTAATARLDAAASALGDELGVDGPAALRLRQGLPGGEDLVPAGTVSAGGTCRLVRAADRWFAINLARPDDRDAVPAWAGHDTDEPVWDVVGATAPTLTAEDAVARAQLLGIPAAVAWAPDEYTGPSVTVRGEARGALRRSPVVVDLSALWAGPWCARLLGDALGARVVKVEDLRRPDGARSGPPAFWRALNAGKEERHVDLGSATGRAELAETVAGARVVVSAARPRALAGLGLDPEAFAARGGVWVSITGYGLEGPWSDRVAFGDDAAVAGGLAVAAGGPDAPEFVGDAVADPLAGLAAAVVARRIVVTRRGGVVDVAMAGVVNRALRA